MCLYLIVLLCTPVLGRFGGPNPISRNSRFGGFNSRLGLRKFPIRATAGIWSQSLEIPRFSWGQTAAKEAKSQNRPYRREKTGNLQEHLRRGAEKHLPDGLVMGVARLDLLRDGVDVAEAALERAAGKDRVDPSSLVSPVGDC